ncbi:hypothetical protein RND71_022421 [Anisodus tanguticus]|uniref:Pentatricopeptide repeat-containing protein n=1 Tax=Anisodus tanguticus TaxID=243964 RepID=A0AAE1RTL5_9SOLA|nr:hypothetical protein RND71_022421 [Anisodus tanguticus]
MFLDTLWPDHFVFASIVKACANLGALKIGKQVHSQFLKLAFSQDDVVKSLVDMRKNEAIDLLRKLPEKNLQCWTALISGREGVDMWDPFILSSIVGACASLAALQIHRVVLGLGYESSLFVSNALVDMYAKCSDISEVTRDVVSWTSIIVGMAKHGKGIEALSLYDDMISAGIKPNEVTFVGLIYACSLHNLQN